VKFRGKMADPFCGWSEEYGGDRYRRLVLAAPPTPGYPPFIYFHSVTVTAAELVNDPGYLRCTSHAWPCDHRTIDPCVTPYDAGWLCFIVLAVALSVARWPFRSLDGQGNRLTWITGSQLFLCWVSPPVLALLRPNINCTHFSITPSRRPWQPAS
jgi:hypothetical protein